MVRPGQIVILNGAPRSGKSSIARVMQETCGRRLDESRRRCCTSSKSRRGSCARASVFGREANGPLSSRCIPIWFAALYESIAAHSRLGLNVVVDIGHHDSYTEAARDSSRLRAPAGGAAGAFRGRPLFDRGGHAAAERRPAGARDALRDRHARRAGACDGAEVPGRSAQTGDLRLRGGYDERDS